MRTRLFGLLAALLLLVAACNDGNDVDEPADPADEPEDTALEEPEVDLDDDLAAEVNGEPIPRETVEERVDETIEADEELAAQVEGEEGEQMLEMVRAQMLTFLIQTRIIMDGAAELDVEPTEEDIEEAREELVAELGGQEEFDDAVAQAGITDSALDEQLEGVAALNAVGEHLVEEGDVPEVPEDAEGLEDVTPEDMAVQQWLGEQLANATIVVHPDYGQWDPQSGQVMPSGAMMPPMPEEGVPEDLPEELPEEELPEELQEEELPED